jgi:hypothetical protein
VCNEFAFGACLSINVVIKTLAVPVSNNDTAIAKPLLDIATCRQLPLPAYHAVITLQLCSRF